MHIIFNVVFQLIILCHKCDDVRALTWCSVTDEVVCDDVETLTWCSVTDDVVCDDVETLTWCAV